MYYSECNIHESALSCAQGTVADIVYREPTRVSPGTVHVVSGVAFLPSALAQRLLSMSLAQQLDGCTYQGLDGGALPLQVLVLYEHVFAQYSFGFSTCMLLILLSGSYNTRGHLRSYRTRFAEQIIDIYNYSIVLLYSLRRIHYKVCKYTVYKCQVRIVMY